MSEADDWYKALKYKQVDLCFYFLSTLRLEIRLLM